MSKIFWICMQCFKTNEQPEEIKSNKELTILSDSHKQDSASTEKPNRASEVLKLPESKEYVRKKYVRVRSKTAQTSQLDVSISSQDMSHCSDAGDIKPGK